MNELFEQIKTSVEAVQSEFSRVIVGKEDITEWMLVGLFVGGHVLLEGVPGTSKTLMVRTLAKLLDVEFNRVQFTPDLMPSDILGTNVFQLDKGQFNLVKGPIFTDFLLADEINRTPAKTQSALLEAMEERQATIDGVQYPMSQAFTVFATMNPLEYEGTYSLPEAQLDRFLLKLLIDYPSVEEEDEILKRYHGGFDAKKLDALDLKPVLPFSEIEKAREAMQQVEVTEGLLQYIRKIVCKTRDADELLLGGGPRASIAMLLCAKALAVIRGRDYVIPEDVKATSLPVLRHRLIMEPDLQVEGYQIEEVIEALINAIPIPR